MANTYTQLYTHIVFAVKGRENIISKIFREELHKYITGIITNKGQKLIAIFCMPDHVHILVSLKPNANLSDLVRDIKSNSSRYIMEKKWVKGRFNWQEGFGAFSVSPSVLDATVKYILNQETNHASKPFKNEYLDLLKKYDIDYKDEYLFEWIEEHAAPTEL